MPAFCKLFCVAAVLAFICLTGCTAAPSPAPLAMMSATCAPGQRPTMAVTTTQPAASAQVEPHEEPANHDFVPLFSATCRPDHQFHAFNMITHTDLALAFIEARPAPTYDFVPMFSASASPAARR